MRGSLTIEEARAAALAGVEQTLDCIYNKRKRVAGDNSKEPLWFQNIEGKMGEMLFAKYANKFFNHELNTFKTKADIRPNIEIRTRSSDFYELYVRPGDIDDRIFVLVRGFCPHYDIVGYMRGSKAKQHQEWLKRYGGMAPAYFVPDHELTEIIFRDPPAEEKQETPEEASVEEE